AEADARAAAALKPRPPAPVEAPASRPGRGLRIAGLASAGAGVVALGVGIGFGVHAHRISGEAAGWDTFDPVRYDQGKSAERSMYIFTGVGAGMLVAGGVLYYLGHRHSAEASAITIAPTLGSEQLGLAAAGRF
ncbi:MAG: hypothetical protein K8W52_31455, partial [Deltaproteobacteria bacterium]|nr:hypothetical protein [Deltaproteobacteria bacterium]